MDKQKQYGLFLKSLRVALTNVSIYAKDHPIFVKSMQDLKDKITELFQFKSCLDIEINYDSLSFNGEKLEASALVEDVGNFLHRRKIKNIRVEKTVSLEDLTIFLQKVSLAPKDICLNGGLRVILDQEKVASINIKDLDYSSLLLDESLEYKYSWFYLLKDSLKNNDTVKLQLLSDTFEKMLAQFDTTDPVDVKELELIVGEFFSYLRQNDKTRFLNCLSAFVRLILEAPPEIILGLGKIKDIFGDLESDDLAAAIFSKLESVKNFDSLNFNLFSQLVKRQAHEKIASSLAKRLEQAKWIKDNPQAMERIKNIFSLPEDLYISEVYQHNLSSVLSTISLGEGSCFDHKQLKNNYRFMLLDLLMLESEPGRLDTVISRILAELSDCFRTNDRDYVDKFINVFQNQRSKRPSLVSFFKKTGELVSEFIEEAIFSQATDFDFSRLISIMQVSTHGYQFYFNKMFKEPALNKYVFQIFFKFFPKEVNRFCHSCKLYSRNLRFSKSIIDNLRSVESQIALAVYKRIFVFSNELIKLEIFRAMQEFSSCDEEFLFSILKAEKTIFRKQAFKILAKQLKLRLRLADELFSLTNPFGVRTHRLRENLSFVAEKYFPEARSHLLKLTKYRFFWNRAICRKASEILAEYGK